MNALCLTMAILATPLAPKTGEPSAAPLDGEWKLISLRVSGVDEDFVKDGKLTDGKDKKGKAVVWTIVGTKLTEARNKQVEMASLVIDTKRRPNAIDIHRGKQRTRAIFKIDGNHLAICEPAAFVPVPKGKEDTVDEPRPKGFLKKGEFSVLYVFERTKP